MECLVSLDRFGVRVLRRDGVEWFGWIRARRWCEVGGALARAPERQGPVPRAPWSVGFVWTGLGCVCCAQPRRGIPDLEHFDLYLIHQLLPFAFGSNAIGDKRRLKLKSKRWKGRVEAGAVWVRAVAATLRGH